MFPKNFLEHNPQTQEVYYLILPRILANDLDLVYSYQYFVIPFMNDYNRQLIESTTLRQLYHNYKFGKFFVDNEYVKRFLLNDKIFMSKYVNCVKLKTVRTYTHRLSETSVIYLAKIRELCRSRNIKLFVRPLPMSDIENNYGWEDFERDIKYYGFEDILGDFIKRFKYYPEDWFYDKTHFTREILEQYGDEIRASILQ